MIDRLEAINAANEAVQLRDQFKSVVKAEVSENGVKNPILETTAEATNAPTFGPTRN